MKSTKSFRKNTKNNLLILFFVPFRFSFRVLREIGKDYFTCSRSRGQTSRCAELPKRADRTEVFAGSEATPAVWAGVASAARNDSAYSALIGISVYVF
jgi:hypothetical protein